MLFRLLAKNKMKANLGKSIKHLKRCEHQIKWQNHNKIKIYEALRITLDNKLEFDHNDETEFQK